MRRAISPTWLAPISTIRNSRVVVDAEHRDRRADVVVERSGGATVGPSASRIARSRFLVVVLPFEPVIAATRSRPRARTRATTRRARPPGPPRRPAPPAAGRRGRACRSATTRAAPASTAAGANRCAVGLFAGQREEDRAGLDEPRVGLHRARRPRCRRETPSGSTSAPPRASRDLGQTAARSRPARLAQRRARQLARRVRGAHARGCRGSPDGRVRPRGSSRPRAPARPPCWIAASGGLTS